MTDPMGRRPTGQIPTELWMILGALLFLLVVIIVAAVER